MLFFTEKIDMKERTTCTDVKFNKNAVKNAKVNSDLV